ncbi:acyl carrier protein [Streptomyces sp. NPDC001717]|uniref:acyl carrier protein n=1 Tax=Streptomyces sp. NPDC001717 TaxID=3364604 RepID=UPI00368AC49B
MTAPTARTAPGAAAPLHRWLLDRAALYLRRPAATLDPGVPLAEYGLDSVIALSLCGDLEDEFGLQAEPTLLWDHPTLEGLGAYLATVLPDGAATLPAGAATAPTATAPTARRRG